MATKNLARTVVEGGRSRYNKYLPWDQVRSEMARRFDTRTIDGQHIVFDHLLPSVRGSGCSNHWRPRWVVDTMGILRRGNRRAA